MECGVPFCQAGQMIAGMASGCPLHNLVPETNDLVYRGKWKLAYERLSKTHSFPEFTSHVCPALCEAACTCGLNGDPVSTKDNEKAIIETAWEKGWVTPKIPPVRTGKKVAVVGSGPSGLAAAQELNRKGHLVTVYERRDRVGGLLRYGIPNMKLEKSLIDRRVALMEAEGVVFQTSVDVGKDVKAKDLLKEYDRVVLACGGVQPKGHQGAGKGRGKYCLCRRFPDFRDQKPAGLGSEGRILPPGKGKACAGHRRRRHGQRLCGNGDPPGCKIGHSAGMMPKPPEGRAAGNPWPEWPKVLKTDYGQEEAIAVFGKDPRIYQTTVTEFLKDEKGNVAKARIVSLEPKKDEKTGRMNMVPVEGTQKVVEAQLVLIAAGFPGKPALCDRRLSGGTGPKDQCAHRARGIPDQRAGSVYLRGYAPGASLWWCGPSRREERPRRRWTTT